MIVTRQSTILYVISLRLLISYIGGSFHACDQTIGGHNHYCYFIDENISLSGKKKIFQI
jgi:hypothetical protein